MFEKSWKGVLRGKEVADKSLALTQKTCKDLLESYGFLQKLDRSVSFGLFVVFIF